MLRFAICCGPARHMLAPLSGNMFILTGLMCWCRGRDGNKIAGISSIDVNVVVVVNVSES